MTDLTLSTKDETLREALIDLEKAREREALLHRESESLIEGLKVLIEPADSKTMFSQLLEVMRKVLEFEQACVLIGRQNGELIPVASTSDLFTGTRWVPGAGFRRILSGNPAAYFDIEMIPEWQLQPRSIRNSVTSALHTPLRTGNVPAMLVCTHSERAHFNTDHLNLVKRFAPLAAQALLNAEARELQFRQHLLEEEKAAIEERNKLLQQARDAALSVSRAKSGFLATMSHEIRTPMSAVLGILGLLRDTPLDSRQQQLVQTARESGELLLSIINNILDFSKMEADRLNLEHTGFDLQRLFTRTIELLRHQAEHKGLALELTLKPDLPRYGRGDPDRLRQILINLIGNAIKFTPSGSINVQITATSVSEDTVTLRCTVKDTGIGIDQEHQASLFEEFFMADQSHARRHEGSGLGLAICKCLVSLMGGSIGCSSEPGKGSTFWFEVTLNTADADECDGDTQQEDLRSLPAADTRILLAEDNPANRLVAKSILENAGLHVDIAANGREALDAIRTLPYDLVLMDISMPEMDGMTATREIRKLSGQASKIPIVALTAHALPGDKERFLDVGMDDYLTKPINRDATLYCIARWTGGNLAEKPEKDTVRDSPDTLLADSDAGYVDEQVLQQLAKDTAPEVVPELLKLYVDDARKRVEQIQAAVIEGNMKVLEFEAHTLGSSASVYGNLRLHVLARQIEHLCQNANQDGALGKALLLPGVAVKSFQLLEKRAATGFG